MSGATCREQSSTDASDSSMCGSNCASRPGRASGSSRKVSRRKGNFPLASILVADISQSCFYSPVMSDDSGRNSREETTGKRRRQDTGCGEERNTPQPETLAHSDTSNYRSRSGSVQTTTNGRLSKEDFGLSASNRTESVSRECILGMDDVSVMCSPLESKDRPGRRSGKDGADNRSTSIDTSLSRMCNERREYNRNKTETFFGCSRFLLCKRVVHTSHIAESRVSPFTHSCSAAQTLAEQVMVLDSDSVGSEESFAMLNVPAESVVT